MNENTIVFYFGDEEPGPVLSNRTFCDASHDLHAVQYSSPQPHVTAENFKVASVSDELIFILT